MIPRETIQNVSWFSTDNEDDEYNLNSLKKEKTTQYSHHYLKKMCCQAYDSIAVMCESFNGIAEIFNEEVTRTLYTYLEEYLWLRGDEM